MARALVRVREAAVPASFWHGSLIHDKQDHAGTHFRRNRYYDPETGKFTQEDPIGLAGGMNLYGFAGGDPVNYGDPFGLKVCFNGTARDVNRLRRGTEDATNTIITLAKDNCVSGFEARKGKGFTEIQARFNDLVSARETFVVRFGESSEAFYSHYDPRTRQAFILRRDVGGFRYNTGNRWTCALFGGTGSAPMSLGGLIVHELIGHARGAGEKSSRILENQYHRARGQPTRCLGG